jgi:thymidylate synthase ThyX
MYAFEAKVIEDSTTTLGKRITTMQLRYPRFIHAEMMTHRVFSRNASSSRAIPVTKMLEQVRNEPAMPIHWGQNQPGMQADQELCDQNKRIAQVYWIEAAKRAADTAQQMNEMGLHKQVANRILEPFQFISVVVTATEWENFFKLRDHTDAQPEIKYLAQMMKAAMSESIPTVRFHSMFLTANVESWHLPYVTQKERLDYKFETTMLAKVSSARCARVSYLTHEGKAPDIAKDLDLYDRLVGSEPIHASPTEHPAEVARQDSADTCYKNFRGWVQHRINVEKAFA